MRDAVAEVLEERQYLDQNISSGLLLSIVLHSLLLVPIILSVSRTATTAREPIRVRLAGAQPAEIQKPATGVAPVIETPAKPVPPQPVELPPQTPPETPRPETKQVEKSLFGQSPEKPVDRKADDDKRAAPSKKPPQEAVPAAPSDAQPGAASPATTSGPAISVGGGSAQISGLEGGDFPYTFYVERMLGIIGGNWFRPDVGKIPGATIHFVISRNGTIGDAEITVSSGSSTFDRAARRAVLESNPLPPLPLQYGGTELGVHLKFN